MTPLQSGDLLAILVALWLFLAAVCVACAVQATRANRRAVSDPWPEIDEWEAEAQAPITEALGAVEPAVIFADERGADRARAEIGCAARFRLEVDDSRAVQAWLRDKEKPC